MMNEIAILPGGIGPWEIAVILVIALLIFGRRLPDVGRSLGRSIIEFKKGLKGIEDDIEGAGTEEKNDRSHAGQNVSRSDKSVERRESASLPSSNRDGSASFTREEKKTEA